MAKAKNAVKPAVQASMAQRDVTKSTHAPSPSPAELISERIKGLGDWRGETLARVRMLIMQSDPSIVEEWKWDVPVWSSNGILCTGETYKNAVKLTFAKGASLEDPSGLFNSSLEGKTRRAIDLIEGQRPGVAAFKALVRAAVQLNAASSIAKKSGRPPTAAGSRKKPTRS